MLMRRARKASWVASLALAACATGESLQEGSSGPVVNLTLDGRVEASPPDSGQSSGSGGATGGVPSKTGGTSSSGGVPGSSGGRPDTVDASADASTDGD